MADPEKLEEICLVRSDLRYLIHKENTFDDFKQIAQDYYHRIAQGAEYAAEMLPDDVVEKLDGEDE